MQGKHAIGFLGTGCLVVLAIGLLFGGVCFDYVLEVTFGKDIHWFGDMICGFVGGSVIVPAAIICFILVLCGIETPFFVS